MMDLFLPGRDSDSEDYEAQCALRTLLESDKIKNSGDDELLSRVSEQIKYNMSMLERVAGLVDGLMADDEEEPEQPSLFKDEPTQGERTDTRTIEDFLARVNRKRREENRKNNQPLKG